MLVVLELLAVREALLTSLVALPAVLVVLEQLAVQEALLTSLAVLLAVLVQVMLLLEATLLAVLRVRRPRLLLLLVPL